MGKWFGKIGYCVTKETTPGTWDEQVTEHEHFGQIIDDSRRHQSGNNANEDVDVTVKISILSDPFVESSVQHIRYVEFMGALWEVTSVQPKPPRLILTLGGVYNGKQA